MATSILTDFSQPIDRGTQPNTFIKSFNLIEVRHIDDDALCLVRAQGTQQLSSVLASKLSIYLYGNEAFLLGAAGAEGYHHV